MYGGASKRQNFLRRTGSSSLRPSRKLDTESLASDAREEASQLRRLDYLGMRDRRDVLTLELDGLKIVMGTESDHMEQRKLGNLIAAVERRLKIISAEMRRHKHHAGQMSQIDILSRAMRDVLSTERCEAVIARKNEIERYIEEYGYPPPRA